MKEEVKFDIKTIVLYSCIILFAALLACFSQSKIKKRTASNGQILYCRDFRIIPFALSFVLLAFFACTTSVGADRITYGMLFNEITWETVGNGQEIGFNLFMLFVSLFTDEPAVFCGILAFLTVLLVYKGLFDCRNDIYIGLAVLIYASQYYLQEFNLMRIYFAMSILIGAIGLLKKKKYFAYFWVIVIAFLFHYSVIFVLAAYLLGMIYIKLPKISFMGHVLWSVIVVAAGMVVLIAFGDVIANIRIPMLQRYAEYLKNISLSSIGFMVIFQNIPMVIVLYLGRRFIDKYQFRRFALAYEIACVAIGLLAYSVPVIGRALTVLNFPLLIYVPYMTEHYKKASVLPANLNTDACRLYSKRKIKRIYIVLISILLVYLLVMYVVYLQSYLELDKINNFTFIWENYLW